MSRSGVIVLALLVLTGCVSAPRREGTSPALSDTQVAALLQRAKSPEALGIHIKNTPVLMMAGGVNELTLPDTVALSMVELPVTSLDDPSARYRLPIVRATVNGKPNVPVLLDSGSNRNLLGYSLAQEAGVSIIAGLKPVPAHGIGGKVDSYWAILPHLQAGGLELRKLVALVGPDAEILTFTRRFWGNTQVMVLGLNSLRSLSFVSFDFPRGQVVLGPRVDYLPDSAATSVAAVPLHWDNDVPAVDAWVARRFERRCLLDTGGDFGLFLPREMATALDYWKPGWGGSTTARGIAGESQGRGYIVHEVKVGDVVFRDLPARSQLEGPEPAGGRVVLGTWALRQYRVTFDFRRNVLWLEQ